MFEQCVIHLIRRHNIIIKKLKLLEICKRFFLGGGYRVVVFGCGGQARSIINVLRETDESMERLLVDKNAHCGETIMGCKVMCECELKENDGYIIAIGDNADRSRLFRFLLNNNVGHCISVISMHAHIGMESKIGRGTFVAANAYIGPMSEIGNNAIINTGCIVEHETIIGDNSHIAPNATICGSTQIGSNVFCGAGSTVIDKINICDNVIIGAGAVVKEDIVEAGTYVGVPARKIS